MKYLWIVAVIITSALSAQVYQSLDKQGNIVYSDEYQPGAEVVDIPTATSYNPTVIDQQQQAHPQAIVNYEITILSPQSQQAVWSTGDDGAVAVVVEVLPSLAVNKDHKLIVTVDGNDYGVPQSSTSFTISILERGLHTIAVALVDRFGQVLVRSATTTFQVHRPIAK